MGVDKGKRSKVTEEDDSDHIDGDLVLSIEKLQEVQDELDKINDEVSEKVLEVEQKYIEMRRPVYERRNGVIKNIPDFWLTAFIAHPALSELLTEEDHKIFIHLDSVDVEDFKDVKSGYSITFNFKENPYFENAKLTKMFTFLDDGTAEITGTDIRWKEGMGTTNGVGGGKKGKKRPAEDNETSFFLWFGETELRDLSDFQDEVAEIIKDDLWPNPLKYFNNEADEENSDEDNKGENDDDDDDEDNEEEEDEDEDED